MISFYIQWLKEEFLPYLNEWEKSVKERDKFSDLAKKKMLLSRETLLGIRITGTLNSACIIQLSHSCCLIS